jgi:LuxR family transcriptional regulator, quorum-sensing system regulator BjaR1
MPAVEDLALRAFAYVERIGKIATFDELAAAFLSAVEPLGLNAAACGVVNGPRLVAGQRFFFIDWPQDWFHLYDQENFLAIDPVPRWVASTGRATTIGQMLTTIGPRDQGQRVIDAGADFNLREGMIIPFALRDGSAAVVSTVGDRKERMIPAERAFVEIIAAATLRRAVELDAPQPGEAFQPALTPRELDCVALLVRGLSDRDIGAKLGIAEPTVRFHLDRARRKFGATSRTHLAALAIWLGLARL